MVRRHDGLQQICGAAPTAVKSAKNYFRYNREAMAVRIGGDHTYLFGDRMSRADILLMTCLDWAVPCGIALPEIVTHYRQRVVLRPTYHAVLKKNFGKS